MFSLKLLDFMGGGLTGSGNANILPPIMGNLRPTKKNAKERERSLVYQAE